MKKVLLGSAVLLALLSGCTEEKKPVVQAEVTQEIKKDETALIQEESSNQIKEDETVTIEKTLEELKEDPDQEEIVQDEEINQDTEIPEENTKEETK